MAMQSLREKKENKIRQEELSKYGVLLSEITPGHSSGRAYACFVRGTLIFLLTMGTILATLTPFELPCNYLVLAVVLFIMSHYAAFLYYNKVTFYAGYILFFILFSLSSFGLYWYVNSGYQAFSNEVARAYSDYFHLASYREAQEYITNRALTVTSAAIFMGIMLSVLLNITISGYMNLPLTFLITFPIIQIPIYIGRIPSPIFLAFILAVYITVGVLQRSRHFAIPPYNDRKRFFIDIRKPRKKKTYHSYLSSGYGLLQTAFYSILLSILFLLITNTIFYTDLGSQNATNAVKKRTDEFLKTFSQSGITSFFDRYSSTGGLANGRLGGVSNVTPDYQYDLKITFVPYSTETVYLRSYVGDTYLGNEFAHKLEPLYENGSDYESHGADAWMEVEILDQNANALYRPYDTRVMLNEKSAGVTTYAREGMEGVRTLTEDSYDEIADTLLLDNSLKKYNRLPLTSTSENDKYYSIFTPYQIRPHYEDNPLLSEEEEAYVYESYLQVPADITEDLETFCKEAKLPHFEKGATDEESRLKALQVASALRKEYLYNFNYTMAPGTTPWNRDVVSYFLLEQKRGYCMHFAASSAVVLRYLGIPTRYVEGYVIKLSDLNDAVGISDDEDVVSAWYDGYNELDETGLVSVNVTDGNAHAWVEIYLDGYGWIPYEFTPPSDDDDTMLTGFSFLGAISGLFRTTENAMEQLGENATNLNIPKYKGFTAMKSMRFLLEPLLYILVFVFLLSLGLLYATRIKNFVLCKMAERKEDYNKALSFRFRNEKKASFGVREYILYRGELLENTKKEKRDPNLDLSFLEETLYLSLYGNTAISKETYLRAKAMFHK